MWSTNSSCQGVCYSLSRALRGGMRAEHPPGHGGPAAALGSDTRGKGGGMAPRCRPWQQGQPRGQRRGQRAQPGLGAPGRAVGQGRCAPRAAPPASLLPPPSTSVTRRASPALSAPPARSSLAGLYYQTRCKWQGTQREMPKCWLLTPRNPGRLGGQVETNPGQHRRCPVIMFCAVTQTCVTSCPAQPFVRAAGHASQWCCSVWSCCHPGHAISCSLPMDS